MQWLQMWRKQVGSLRPPRPSASSSPLSAPPLPPPPPSLFFVEGSTLIGICSPHSKSDGKTPNHRTGPRERKEVRILGLPSLTIFSILAWCGSGRTPRACGHCRAQAACPSLLATAVGSVVQSYCPQLAPLPPRGEGLEAPCSWQPATGTEGNPTHSRVRTPVLGSSSAS